MMINKDNYELFAIDYIEGKLDQETKSDMDKFLAEHPSLKSEMDALIDPVVMEADESIVFNQKSLLKKESRKHVAWISIIRRAAAAAVIALAIAAAWIINSNDSLTDSPIIIANNQTNKNTDTTEKNNQEKTITPKTTNTQIAINSTTERPKIKAQINQSPKNQITSQETKKTISKAQEINEPIDVVPMLINIDDAIVAEASKTAPAKTLNTPETIDIEQINAYDLKNITVTNIETPTIPMDLIADANTQVSVRKKKGQWLLNAITKKSDGTEIFAFQGLKKALTPTRLRDAQVDQASSDSPLKKLTND